MPNPRIEQFAQIKGGLENDAIPRINNYYGGESISGGIFACKVISYDGIISGTHRYTVCLLLGQTLAETFLIKDVTVCDQSAEILNVDTYCCVRLTPAEPPLILSGGGGGSSGSWTGDNHYHDAFLIRAQD